MDLILSFTWATTVSSVDACKDKVEAAESALALTQNGKVIHLACLGRGMNQQGQLLSL